MIDSQEGSTLIFKSAFFALNRRLNSNQNLFCTELSLPSIYLSASQPPEDANNMLINESHVDVQTKVDGKESSMSENSQPHVYFLWISA